MTSEERILNLEKEIANLKEELNKNKKANVWKKVKDKFSSDFNSFNWTHIHNTTDYNGNSLTFQRSMNESDKISTAIATIVRVSIKRKGINYLQLEDEERATDITRQILEIIKNERNENK